MAHKYEKLIKCPYCNYEWEDSWEFDEDEGLHTCGSCEMDFNVSREINVTYSTSKIDCKDDSHNFVVDKYHIFKKTFDKGQWIPLPEENYKYFLFEKCTQCDNIKYTEISKEMYFDRVDKK